MKKSILISFLLFPFLITFSQDTNLLNRDWHIHELFIDDELIDIPVLPADPPSECILGLHIELINDHYFIDLGVCTMFGANIGDVDENSFGLIDFGGLLGKGPCYLGSTTDGCTAIPGYGELADFEGIHHSFYEDMQSTFTYAIIPPGSGGYETLHIEKPNGDYAIYGEVPPPLSVASNNFNIYSIYPNPASDVLYIKGNIQEIKAIAVYSLSGQKMNVQVGGDKIDVSEVPSGLYFLEVVTFADQKSFQKFIRK